uniref:Uncharacterized protein DKFZp686C09257 n=1 Tax=Homo sapiens TaxID=9606 RepID=Q68D45_HUMAN|nr:hypothetical protein [Homo sapiens]
MLLILLSVALLAFSSAQDLDEDVSQEDVPLVISDGGDSEQFIDEEGHKDHPNREAISKVLPHLLLESPRDHLPKGAAHKDLHRGSLLSNLGFNDRK